MKTCLYGLSLFCLYYAFMRLAELLTAGLAFQLHIADRIDPSIIAGFAASLAYGGVYWVTQRYKRNHKP